MQTFVPHPSMTTHDGTNMPKLRGAQHAPESSRPGRLSDSQGKARVALSPNLTAVTRGVTVGRQLGCTGAALTDEKGSSQ